MTDQNPKNILKTLTLDTLRRQADITIKSAELAGREKGADISLAKLGKKIIGE